VDNIPDPDDGDFVDRTRAASESGHPGDPESSVWDSDDAFESLKMERSVQGDEKPDEMAMRILKEAAPMAAASIVHIALHSANDNTRLAAGRYVVDLAREADVNGQEGWESLVADVVSSAELMANAPQRPGSGN
jgi:hypothetical protein